MRTLAQIEASRRNGAKSHGPATPEGKAASSQNAVKHGLRARELHLTPEEEEDYLELYDSYMAHYEPESPLEAHLVRKCAITDHLLSRARSIQHTLIDLQAVASQEDLDHAYLDLDAPGIRAAGFQLLNDRSTSFRIYAPGDLPGEPATPDTPNGTPVSPVSIGPGGEPLIPLRLANRYFMLLWGAILRGLTPYPEARNAIAQSLTAYSRYYPGPFATGD